MRIVTKIIAVIATSIVMVTVGWSISIYISPFEDQFTQPFELEMDEDDHTLTVGDVNTDINWDDIGLEGDATRPSGSVDEDDVITDCYGTVSLYFPNGYFFTWEFDERPDIHLFGEWENAYQQLNFDSYGNYHNSYFLNFDDTDDSNESIIKAGTVGEYKAKGEKLTFNASLPDVTWDYCFLFGANYNLLTLWNESRSVEFNRAIYRVKNITGIEEYSYQKVNITGNLSVDPDETTGNLTLNDSNATKVLVSFEDYNKTNISSFDSRQVEIIGFLYQVCDCDFWDGPCIKNVESIQITDE